MSDEAITGAVDDLIAWAQREDATNMAREYAAALERKARAEEKARLKAAELEAEALAQHVYNPRPYPEAEPLDTAMYEGTGIGFLYGLPGCERFASELGDWTLGKEPA